MARRVLILGATSAIAQETAKLLARDGDRLFLVALEAERLEFVARDLAIRSGQEVGRLSADLNDLAGHDEILDEAHRALDGLDTLLVAYGVLGDEERSQVSYADADLVLRTNFLSAVSMLTRAARRFEAQGKGTLLAITSVAGDRGRQSNYVYGASKGGLDVFMQGLRNRMFRRGVRVLTVKPGMVDTPMTAHMEKGLLFSKPETIARGIHRAIRRGTDVVYLPWFWRVIMGVIRLIPEPVFKRMKL
jgi:short-subunit dehydrogenase